MYTNVDSKAFPYVVHKKRAPRFLLTQLKEGGVDIKK